MAKTKVVSTYQYPSRFGSHKSMLIHDKPAQPGFILCGDEYGDYYTEEYRLDNGLADPNRTAQSRLNKLFSGTKKEDPKAGRR